MLSVAERVESRRDFERVWGHFDVQVGDSDLFCEGAEAAFVGLVASSVCSRER